MSRETTDATIDGTDVTVGLVDGRVAMNAEVTDALKVQSPAHLPLSEHECHASLRVVADDVRVTIDLDGPALDHLIEGLQLAREFTDD